MMFVVDWCSGRCSHDNRLALPLIYDSDTTLGEVAMKVSILPLCWTLAYNIGVEDNVWSWEDKA